MGEQGLPEQRPVVLVSGLSGAGKASILRILEDLGYEAVDNPPLHMLEALVRDAGCDARRHLAIGIDARSHGFDQEAVLGTLTRLRRQEGPPLVLVFASADEEVLQRRFTQTRRRHPLAASGRVTDGIAVERTLTNALLAAADMVIDTTNLPLPELRRVVEHRFGDASWCGRSGLSVTLLSFAYPAGLPRDADMVFDVRFLRNPHYVDALRDKTGLDPDVAAFIETDPFFLPYFEKAADLVRFVLPRFVSEGKKYVTIAVGCTGGRHRSVQVVERLTTLLRRDGWRASGLHRELAAASSLAVERGMAHS